MDDDIEILKRESRRRALRNFGIFIAVVLIIGLIFPLLLLILGIILMLAGVSAMYDLGTVLEALWKRLPREEKSLEEKAYFDRNFYEGIMLSGAGFFVFFLSLYLMSIGWNGIL